jgi:hypothetical protein
MEQANNKWYSAGFYMYGHLKNPYGYGKFQLLIGTRDV